MDLFAVALLHLCNQARSTSIQLARLPPEAKACLADLWLDADATAAEIRTLGEQGEQAALAAEAADAGLDKARRHLAEAAAAAVAWRDTLRHHLADLPADDPTTAVWHQDLYAALRGWRAFARPALQAVRTIRPLLRPPTPGHPAERLAAHVVVAEALEARLAEGLEKEAAARSARHEVTEVRDGARRRLRTTMHRTKTRWETAHKRWPHLVVAPDWHIVQAVHGGREGARRQRARGSAVTPEAAPPDAATAPPAPAGPSPDAADAPTAPPGPPPDAGCDPEMVIRVSVNATASASEDNDHG